MIRAAVIGASGYTGAELVRLLLGHPGVELAGLYARASAGRPIAEALPQLAGVVDRVLEPVDPDAIAAGCDVAFAALPHGESAPVVAALVARGVPVLDLSADLRLADPDAHRTWYGADPEPELRARAVYGLPERHRDALRGARLVAVPGCYPTAAILAVAPLLDLVDGPLVVDAKSGVTGAGRTPTAATHFPEVAEGIRPYKVAGTHRHTAEMEQELGLRVTFTPHLVPMSRGILACVYARPRAPADVHAVLARAYAGEPFVTVLPAGAVPDTAHVRGSNRVHVAVHVDRRADVIVAMAAIDNLVKGAAGQAVQCMNLALGLPETAGLGAVAACP
jgi:N-acetyl-gamma-glutamyl-phosphate reductase